MNRRTDGQMDRPKLICLLNFFEVWGIMICPSTYSKLGHKHFYLLENYSIYFHDIAGSHASNCCPFGLLVVLHYKQI